MVTELLKKLFKSVREYKLPSILTFVFIVLEAVIECFIPFITANMINSFSKDVDIKEILKSGGLLIVLAFLSLACGGIAGFTSSKASSGFAKNLRHDMFAKIQSYSFSNVDKFSSASLVTRITTDVTYCSQAYQMLIRITDKAP